jgi:UDP-glucose 4-epimerase
MKNVLVTGGAGFIGHALTKELIKRGYNVDIIDNLSIGSEARIADKANFLNGDIRAMENIPNKDYTYIFHLAALSRIQPSFNSPSNTFTTNVDGTRKVLEYAKTNNSKVIYAGSSSKHHNPELSPYAMSKYMGEQWLKMYKRVYNLNCEITRFYNVYGEGELVDSHMAAVIGIFREQIKNNKPITIHGDGEQRRDFTYIDDIIDGLIRVAESDHKHSDAWELGTGNNYSINEVYDMFKEVFPNITKIYTPEVQGNYRATSRMNNDAFIRLDWSPKDRIKDYIHSLTYSGIK